MFDMMDERRLMRELAAVMGLEDNGPRPIRKMTLTLEVGHCPLIQIEELMEDSARGIVQVLSKYRLQKVEPTDADYLREKGWKPHPHIVDTDGSPQWFITIGALEKWPTSVVLKNKDTSFFSKEDAVTLQRQLDGNLF